MRIWHVLVLLCVGACSTPATPPADPADARALAQAVVGQALVSLGGDPDYGRAGQTVEVELPGTQGTGTLTFDRARAAAAGIPVSTNNGSGLLPRRGDGDQEVAVGEIHLLGVGNSGGSTVILEARLRCEPFPTVGVASGLIAGPVFVAEVRPETEESPLSFEDAVLPPASGQPSVGSPTPVSSWELELDEADPATDSAVQILHAAYLQDVTLSGKCRREGDLTLKSGVRLKDSALLFVTGDVTIEDGLRGEGTVIALGSIDARGAVELSQGRNGGTLLSRQGTTIAGTGDCGDVLAGGDLEVTGLTLRGRVVANLAESRGADRYSIDLSEFFQAPVPLEIVKWRERVP